jgi:hypothetical protein
MSTSGTGLMALLTLSVWAVIGYAVVPVPLPAYSDAIPITAQSQPWHGGPMAGPVDAELKPHNYVEQEYFISGAWEGRPYRTTVLVRQPSDPRRFSGLVVVEPVHMEGVTAMWMTYHETIMDGGHGWVGIASQKSSAEGVIKKANPARYDSISIPLAPGATGEPEPVFAGGPQDKFSQAILSQFGALLKSNPKSGPFAGPKVKYTVLAGGSQTGALTVRYIIQANPGARLPNGRPIWDAYYPTMTPAESAIAGRNSIVMHVYGEGDMIMFNGLNNGRPHVWRPDSDARHDRFRSYEVPAVSHLPTRGSKNNPLFLAMAGGGKSSTGQDLSLSQFPTTAVYNACFYNLLQWVMTGIAPPHARPIELENGHIVRDQFGNAKGGVRSPYVDMPAYRYIASLGLDSSQNIGNPQALMHAAIGLQVALPPETVQSLYHNRANYLQMFNRQIDQMVAGRFLLRADAEKLKAEEAHDPPL